MGSYTFNSPSATVRLHRSNMRMGRLDAMVSLKAVEEKPCFHLASSEAMASSLPILMLLLCSLTVAQAELRVYNLRATNLPSDFFGTTDGYVKVFINTDLIGETSVEKNEKNPRWFEDLTYSAARTGDILRLEVHDSDPFFDDLVGSCARAIKPGTYSIKCNLMEGGQLQYTYSFL
ncbi:perforin-1-like isoform X2 [Solea solea]|uniref:perforin-1-like isoform X2 n=1 Tax=Solea solea TaxID=90069 RepID=UPI00272B5624|nr:perforin-1-like isoform X2 [Solea solea]